jgi:hypothetical protein
MKNIHKFLSIAFVGALLLTTSCVETEDIMTGNVAVGGLVTPVTRNVPYKIGATNTFDVFFNVPVGPAIQKVELYKTFTNISGKVSNKELLTTLDVNGANTSAVFEGKVTLNYALLTNGLTIDGNPLPSNEALLNIGDAWTLTYISVMAGDERKVINASSTNVGVANAYAGYYVCTGVFTHPTAGARPINEEKYLKPISAYSCRITVGDLGSDYVVDIIVDPATNDVTYANGDPFDIIASAERSYYEPSTGKFYLNYYYVGGTGNRVITEVYTPKN